MKWSVPPIPPAPKHGDTKVTTRFALFPTRIEGDRRVWLERYRTHWSYMDSSHSIMGFGCWIDMRREAIE